MSDDLTQKKVETGNKQNQPENQRNASQDRILPAEIGAEPRTPADFPHSIGDTSKAASETGKPNPHHPSWCEQLTLLLEFVGIVGLAFYCWVNWKEWKTFDNERGTMETELKQIQSQNVLDERAWVGATGGTIEGIKSMPMTNFSCCQVNFRNTGKSPALNMAVFISRSYKLGEIPKTDIRPANPTVSGTLFPDAIETITDQDPLDNDIVRQLDMGMPFYIFGTIWYDDIFGHHHWSQFCYWVRFTSKMDFLPTQIHNGCDVENQAN